VKAVFSTRFKADLLQAEVKYGEISDRLAGELRERVDGPEIILPFAINPKSLKVSLQLL